MTPRKHAALARDLIKSCGGLVEASDNCRLSKSALANAQNVNHEYYLTVDVVADLEAYCGDAVYSRALVDVAPAQSGDGDIVGDAIDLTLKSASLNARLHKALRDGKLSPNEKDALLQTASQLRNGLNAFEAELGEGGQS